MNHHSPSSVIVNDDPTVQTVDYGYEISVIVPDTATCDNNNDRPPKLHNIKSSAVKEDDKDEAFRLMCLQAAAASQATTMTPTNNNDGSGYGYEDAVLPDIKTTTDDSSNKYGYEDAVPDTKHANSKYGYEEAAPDRNDKYGYEDASPDDRSKYCYEDAAPNDDDASKYGYGNASPTQNTNNEYGYGDAAPDTHSNSSRNRRGKTSRRSSMKQMGRTGRRSSIGYTGEIEVQLPGRKEPIRRRTSISFDSYEEVAEVEPIKDLAGVDGSKQLWFQPEEYDMIREKAIFITNVASTATKDAHYSSGHHLCTRGLEPHINADQVRQEQFMAKRSVLVEQEHQRNLGIYDDEIVSKIYQLTSMNSAARANGFAQQDSIVAERHYTRQERMMSRRSSVC